MSRMRIADVNDKVDSSTARLRNFEKRQNLINWLIAGTVALSLFLHFVI
jgi:hypothetical protein